MPHVRVRPERHESAAQKCRVQPEVQVDDPLLPLVQDRAEQDALPLRHGDEGDPMPAVQIFQGAVGKVQKGHRAVPPQGLGQKRPALGGGGPLGAAGNGQDLALEIAAPALGKAAAAQDHILRVVQVLGVRRDLDMPHI